MKRFLILMICLLWSQHLWALTSAYNIRDLMNAARENDYFYQILQDETSKYNLTYKQILSTYFPELNSGANFQYQSKLPKIQIEGAPFVLPETEAGVKDQYNINLELRQLIFDGFQRENNRKIIKEKIDEQDFRKTFRESEIDHLVLQLGYQYYGLELSIKSMLASKKRLDLNLDRVRLFYEEGFKTILDTLEISSNSENLQLKIISLKNTQNQLLIHLQQLTGISSIKDIIIPDDLLLIQPIKDINSTQLSNNFEVKLYDFQKSYLVSAKKSHQSAFFPIVAGFAGYYYGRPGVNFLGDEWMSYLKAGISFQINLWKWGRDRNQIRIDNYSINQLENQKKQILRSKKIYIAQLISQYNSIEEQLKISERILHQQKTRYELVNDQWREGQKSTLDVLDSEQELTEAELRVKTLKIDILSLYQKIMLELNQPNQ